MAIELADSRVKAKGKGFAESQEWHLFEFPCRTSMWRVQTYNSIYECESVSCAVISFKHESAKGWAQIFQMLPVA
jgi:hypothetical protein